MPPKNDKSDYTTQLPQVQSCNRCGGCCLAGGKCELRPLAGLPLTFNGRCEILTDLADGTTDCYLVNHCFADNGHLGLWAAQFLDGNCEWPEHRKEINASV